MFLWTSWTDRYSVQPPSVSSWAMPGKSHGSSSCLLGYSAGLMRARLYAWCYTCLTVVVHSGSPSTLFFCGSRTESLEMAPVALGKFRAGKEIGVAWVCLSRDLFSMMKAISVISIWAPLHGTHWSTWKRLIPTCESVNWAVKDGPTVGLEGRVEGSPGEGWDAFRDSVGQPEYRVSGCQL